MRQAHLARVRVDDVGTLVVARVVDAEPRSLAADCREGPRRAGLPLPNAHRGLRLAAPKALLPGARQLQRSDSRGEHAAEGERSCARGGRGELCTGHLARAEAAAAHACNHPVAAFRSVLADGRCALLVPLAPELAWVGVLPPDAVQRRARRGQLAVHNQPLFDGGLALPFPQLFARQLASVVARLFPLLVPLALSFCSQQRPISDDHLSRWLGRGRARLHLR
jgi:hypothetical protein